MEKILEANHLSKSYGRKNNEIQVLNNSFFSVDQGEFIGIMGPSGAWKSTLLNTILQFLCLRWERFMLMVRIF